MILLGFSNVLASKLVDNTVGECNTILSAVPILCIGTEDSILHSTIKQVYAQKGMNFHEKKKMLIISVISCFDNVFKFHDFLGC